TQYSANRECSTRTRPLFHGLKSERRVARSAHARKARGRAAARAAHSPATRRDLEREQRHLRAARHGRDGRASDERQRQHAALNYARGAEGQTAVLAPLLAGG